MGARTAPHCFQCAGSSFDELHQALGGWLLYAEGTAIGKRPVGAPHTVAVAQFGIERDDFVEGCLEVWEVFQGSLNSTSAP